MSVHPLAAILQAAADGVFPAVDGGWHRVPPWRAGLSAIVGLTGHAVLAIDEGLADAAIVDLDVDGFGGAHHPRVITALAGPQGWIDSLDVLLVARGTGRGGTLVPRPDLAGHPRAELATRLREDVRVLGRAEDPMDCVVILSRGIAGLTELSLEVDPSARGDGVGRALIRAGLDAVPAGELVVPAVAPGNAASLRALLAAGFVPVGSIQLFAPAKGGIHP